MNLYELADEAERVIAALEDSDGEIADADLEAMLDHLGVAIPKKVEGLCHVIRRFHESSATIAAETERLSKLRRSRARAAERLEDYLMRCMDKMGVRRVDTPLFCPTIVNNPPSVRWEGPGDIPDEYVRVVPEARLLDGKAAQDAVRQGKELPSGFVVERGRHLRGIS